MFYQNPDFKDKKIESINDLENCHYSSLLLGGKPLWSMVKEYYNEEENGKIIGLDFNENVINIYFKNKESKNKTEPVAILSNK